MSTESLSGNSTTSGGNSGGRIFQLDQQNKKDLRGYDEMLNLKSNHGGVVRFIPTINEVDISSRVSNKLNSKR